MVKITLIDPRKLEINKIIKVITSAIAKNL
jgi:hypothetical protein